LKIKLSIYFLLFIITAFVLISGTSNVNENPTPLPFIIPKGWPVPSRNIFEKNRLTEEGFQLGKKLFYDGRLSKDGEISCGSCHQQFSAFSTYDHDLSHGINNLLTTRNAPALINLAWMNELHWDGGINHLEVQPLSPITAPNEMGEKLENVLNKLRNDSIYPRMFKAAFKDTSISIPKMLKAIAQFTGNLISSNSRYDKFKRGEAAFTTYELTGYKIFKANCASCHKEPLFTDNSFRNNGQQLNRFKDYGRQIITSKQEDSLKFKVPTLRNAALTFPYMHDGHLYSLYEVIDHYRSGIDTTQKTLDPLLKKKIEISNTDKMNLILFLNTLIDSSFINNPRFSFKIK